MSKVKILRPGLLTTVQDKGRYEHQRFGVSITGSMDSFSSRVANFLVGNDDTEAVLEVTLMGPAIEFLEDCVIAITGANISPSIENNPISMWESILVKKGTTLTFGAIKSGARSYIAFAGGIDVPLVMGSRSTYSKANVGGFEGRPLKANDILPVNRNKTDINNLKLLAISEKHIPKYSSINTLRVVLGPQDEAFTKDGITIFLSCNYKVSNECDRMGYRLNGEIIQHVDVADIISDGIMMGSVQVPGNGEPIILMADRQTTGGYTKIATVISTDLQKIAQAKSGDSFKFKAISVEEAQQVLFDAEAEFELLKSSCNTPTQTQGLAQNSSVQPVFTANSKQMAITINGTNYSVQIEEIM